MSPLAHVTSLSWIKEHSFLYVFSPPSVGKMNATRATSGARIRERKKWCRNLRHFGNGRGKLPPPSPRELESSTESLWGAFRVSPSKAAVPANREVLFTCR